MTKTVRDLEIFSTGTHTDSGGFTETFSGEALDKMVDAFNAGDPWRPAVKLGHTSDEFNQMVADSLGVPVETLGGEDGGGVLALGEVVRLERKQNKLVAELKVPDQVADWIARGLLRDVSSEMIMDDDSGDWVISGLALLGAEAPAVDDLRGLAAAAQLAKGGAPAHAYSRPVPGIVFQGDSGSPMYEDSPAFTKIVQAVKKALFGAEDNMLGKKTSIKFEAEELAALGFADDDDDDKDDPSKEEIKNAIDELKDRAAAGVALTEAIAGPISELAALVKGNEDDDADEEDEDFEDEDEEKDSMDDDEEKDEAAPAAKVLASVLKKATAWKARAEGASGKIGDAIETATKPLLAQIATFETEKKTSKFQSRVADLLIPGTTEDLLADLAAIPDAQAESVLKTWEASTEHLRAMGVDKPIGRATGDADGGDDDPTRDVEFEGQVAEYMRQHGVTEEDATTQVRMANFSKKPESFIEA